MNALLKRALTLGTPAIVGAGAGVAGTVAVSTGAHEAITLAIGDTLTPRFSVHTDTVLHVAGPSIVAARCGTSSIFLRNWQGISQRSADTVDVTVACAPPPPAVASIDVCLFPNPDSMAKYKVSGDTGVDPRLVPCDSATGTMQIAQPASPSQHLGSVMFQPPPATAAPTATAQGDPFRSDLRRLRTENTAPGIPARRRSSLPGEDACRCPE